MTLQKIALIICFQFGVTSAQSVPEVDQAGEQPAAAKPRQSDSEYRLGTGDVLEIAVFGVEQFQYEVKIGSVGAVTLPYVGPIPAGGLTVPEFTEQLTDRLNGTLFRDPQVTVIVREYGSTPIAVFGAVARPGTYQKVDPGFRLIDLLAQAGGVSAGAGEFLVVQRRDPEGAEPETIKINLDELFREGRSSLNIPLEAGDVVNVPSKERQPKKTYYVIGEVGKPGVYELPDNRPILVTQAVAAAGGPLRTAKIGQGKLVRVDESGQRQEMAVNFKKMLNGKQPDVVVHDQDIIFIPGSNIKTIGYGLLGIIPATAQTATTGAVIPY